MIRVLASFFLKRKARITTTKLLATPGLFSLFFRANVVKHQTNYQPINQIHEYVNLRRAKGL